MIHAAVKVDIIVVNSHLKTTRLNKDRKTNAPLIVPFSKNVCFFILTFRSDHMMGRGLVH